MASLWMGAHTVNSVALLLLLTSASGTTFSRSSTHQYRDVESTNSTSATSIENPFESITPSETLQWYPCKPQNTTGDNTTSTNASGNNTASAPECARLLVPFDYANPNMTEERFSIALVRYQAPNKTNYKGPFFLNFGGPGGSGTEALLAEGASDRYRRYIGDEYDLVTWDPRAVGSTLPAVTCYANDASRQGSIERSSHLNLFQANDSLVMQDVENQIVARDYSELSGHLLPYTGTVSVARDLARMNEAYGFSDKLSYLGFSYGTVLGATYAALYPDKVERLILDGNVEPTSWYGEDFFPGAYEDADGVLDQFFQLCFLAGPSTCAFWFPSPEKIKEAFLGIDNRLHSSPIPSSAGPFDWSTWRNAIFQSLYNPFDKFTGPGGIDTLFAMVYNGSYSTLNLSALAEPTSEPSIKPLLDPTSGRPNDPSFNLISCADHKKFQFTDVKDLQSYFESKILTDRGFFVQGSTPNDGLLCGRLNITTADEFNGTFKGVKTSCPILFLSSVKDPVTPLHDAVSSSAGFIGSSLLINNITGHCAMQRPNKCVDEHVRRYIKSGQLPTNGTICQPDYLPFNLTLDGRPANMSEIESAA